MDTFTYYLSSHPALTVTIVILGIIMILHTIFKSLFKLVLVALLILSATVAYYYHKDPTMVEESVQTVKSEITGMVDKSKSIRADTKELYHKSKQIPGQINKMLKASDEEADESVPKNEKKEAKK